MFPQQELGSGVELDSTFVRLFMLVSSVPPTGTGVVPDLIFVGLLVSSVPTTRNGVVLDSTIVILIGSSVPTTGTGVELDLTFVSLLGSGGINIIIFFNIIMFL